MRKWFTRAYWAYLFKKPWNWTKVWCRYREHPYPVRWHCGWEDATEPDMHCRNCDDDLG